MESIKDIEQELVDEFSMYDDWMACGLDIVVESPVTRWYK